MQLEYGARRWKIMAIVAIVIFLTSIFFVSALATGHGGGQGSGDNLGPSAPSANETKFCKFEEKVG